MSESTVFSGLGKQVIASDPVHIKLDQTVKNILAYKPLLARIIKEVVSECREMSFDEIESAIEGDVLVSKVYVDGGLSNSGERIDGLNTESGINGEGLDRYDIRTYLRIPGEGFAESIKLLLNLEAQNDDKPGYDIPLRALFYCCRMISAQQDVEFSTGSDDPVKYGNIKKVYSIWLCTEAARKRANSIEKYDLRRTFLCGSNPDEPRYDILNAIIIYLSRDHDIGGTDNELIKMLTDLFDERIKGPEKVELMTERYSLKMTRVIKEEADEMCNYAEAIEKKGIEQGIEQVNTLNMLLINQNRIDDLRRASEDKDYQAQLLRELFSSQETPEHEDNVQ